MPALSMGGVTKSPLDETFEEFLESNHEYVEQGEQYEAEKAAFEKHQKHAIDNNADASSTHTETLYPGFSELTDDEFAAAHLGGMVPEASIEESRARGGIADPESLRNDPVEYKKYMELKARLESRQIEERTPASYIAVDNGKKLYLTANLAFKPNIKYQTSSAFNTDQHGCIGQFFLFRAGPRGQRRGAL